MADTGSSGANAVELLVQAAVLATANPPSVSSEQRAEATAYLESWAREQQHQRRGEAHAHAAADGSEESWRVAAELVGALYVGGDSSGHGHGQQPPRSALGLAESVVVAARNSQHGHQSQSQQAVEAAASAARTLLLTLLCSKLRRSPPRPTATAASVNGNGATLLHVHLANLAGAIWAGLASVSSASASATTSRRAELNQLCCAAAALSCLSPRGIVGLVQRAVDGGGGERQQPISPTAALRLLSNVPAEASECSVRPAAEIGAEVAECAGMVLSVVGKVVAEGVANGCGGDGPALALRVLGNWSEPCHVTLTQLNTPLPSGGNLLSLLIGTLSRIPSGADDENLITSASQALTVALLEGADFGTPTRLTAISTLFGSIPDGGFLANPLTHASAAGWEDASRSLANLASTLATEEVDLVARCNLRGCTDLLEILLGLQSHPTSLAVSIAPLEAWLAIQDVPLSDRHPDLAAPLFGRVVDVIAGQISLPPTFVSWEEELDVDGQEFEELRRLASDVLVSSYFLLRAGYVDRVVSSIAQRGETWESTEAALWCLIAVSREICDGVKTRRGGTPNDTEEMAGKLMHLARALCVTGGGTNRQHPLVVSAVASFLGSYAPVWNVHCPVETILDMLTYLRASMEIPNAADASAKAIRQVLVGCTGKLVPFARQLTGENNAVVSALGVTMEAALSKVSEEGMRLVAEGCARLCVGLKDGPLVRRSLCVVSDPALRRARHAIDLIRSAHSHQQTATDAAQLEVACQTLATSLDCLEEIIRFCDEPTSENTGDAPSHPLADALGSIWPLLGDVAATPICRKHEDVISSLLAVHSSLLGNASAFVTPHFPQLVSSVVQIYEETKLPEALDYIGTAVETFGSVESADTARSFNELLAHLSRCTTHHVTQETRPSECPLIICSYFDMARRYLLFCPQALTACPEFPTIFSLAVACLDECKGERDSTRATLNFLSQIIGYGQIRLFSPSASAALQATSSVVDAAVLHHGEVITKACVHSLSGGAPQMLWPAYSECLFALIAHLCSLSAGGVRGEQMAHQWMMTALSESADDGKRLEAGTRNTIMHTLFSYAKDGNKSKVRAKMLLGHFGKLCKGETTPDALIAYSLQA